MKKFFLALLLVGTTVSHSMENFCPPLCLVGAELFAEKDPDSSDEFADLICFLGRKARAGAAAAWRALPECDLDDLGDPDEDDYDLYGTMFMIQNFWK